MSREVRPQQPMTDVRAPSAHASPRLLREHPRPCATLARALGVGRGGPHWRVGADDRCVVGIVRRDVVVSRRASR